MQFLLINLNWEGLVSKKNFKLHFVLPPLDLILLSNFAEQAGHQARIRDGFVESLTGIESEAAKADWIVVTTTPYHMWQCPNAEWEWIKKSLERFPKEKTILVGLHASVFPEKTLRETGVRAVIRREPEVVFRAFLEKGDWRQCDGVAYLENDSYHENPLPKLPPIDDLVVQKYGVDISPYGYFLLGSRTGVFESSRGCPWKCTFCDQEMFSWSHREKTPELFVDEVDRAVSLTGMKTAYFYDLEFTIKKTRTFKICEGLIAKNIPRRLKWACQTRADMVHEDTLDALKAAGCQLIHFGVESANPEILKSTNKKITIDKIEQGVRLAKKKGFHTACFFMFGLPGEKADEFENTLEFARALNPTYASFHFAIPFPGTPLYAQYVQEKGVQWGEWPATYFEGWSHKEISNYLRRAYSRFYVTPKKLEPQELYHRLSNIGPKLKYFASIVMP